MKIVMLAALAAALAAPACATEQVAYTQHTYPAAQHHPMPPPRMHVPSHFHHERIGVPEVRQRVYRQPRFIERRAIIRRGYYGGYGGYENRGYGGELLEGETQFHVRTHVHREVHRAWWDERHRTVNSGCNCNCCCNGSAAWLGADPPEIAVEYPPAEEVDDTIGYIPPGFHIVHE